MTTANERWPFWITVDSGKGPKFYSSHESEKEAQQVIDEKKPVKGIVYSILENPQPVEFYDQRESEELQRSLDEVKVPEPLSPEELKRHVIKQINLTMAMLPEAAKVDLVELQTAIDSIQSKEEDIILVDPIVKER